MVSQLTDYHAKYFACELTRRCPSDSVEKFAAALADAQVDLNPHQIDAALLQVFETLKARLKPICHRTLRRQVLPYIKFTKRLPLLEEFTPEESEDRLYHAVSEYLQRDNLQALPASQRTLITLVLRKLLASSTFAIAGALTSMSARLKAKLKKSEPAEPLEEELDRDYEALDETADEWEDEELAAPLSDGDRAAIEQEIADLDGFAGLATSIHHNAKGKALLKALDIAFGKAATLGGAKKAIIFTESRRTQDYLLRLLADSPFAEGIVLFNGSNTDDRSKEIYAAWLERHQGTDHVTGSRTADIRSALVDYFREQGRIMIATEAGAEGINLQFCSLVVNYDLPWNPQRIEQRIGRCHRYGQQHDVVVVNFLNRKNDADRRVFELLSEKFKLFEGVFGASDEVLGAIESGVNFEKRIAGIYQRCRKPDEIQVAFDQLQLEHERLLMQVTRHELEEHAEFVDESAFRLKSCPFGDGIPLGLYELPRRSRDAHLYRMTHPLAEAVLTRAKGRDLPSAEIRLTYADHGGKITLLEPHVGKSGWLRLCQVSIESLDQAEDHLIIAAVGDDGAAMDSDVALRLLTLPGRATGHPAGPSPEAPLETIVSARQQTIQRGISERNARIFEAEIEKLEGWADDLKLGLEREIKELDRQIKEARRAATTALTLEEKLEGQKKIKALEAQRNHRRRSLFDAQDQVDRQREDLIGNIEGKLRQKTIRQELLAVRWTLV